MKHEGPRPPFTGFSSPNYTQVPDELFDVLMPDLKDAELRVLLYIIRRTFGFKRDSDQISLSQLVDGIRTRDGRQLDRGTGLSKTAVARALSGLRTKGIIVAQRNRSAERGNEPTTYRLRFKGDPPSAASGTSPLSRQRDKGLSPARDTQETDNQETVTTVRMTPRRTAEEQALRAEFSAFVADMAIKLHDEAPLASSLGRFVNDFLAARERDPSLTSDAMLTLGYEVYLQTQRYSPTIRKRASGSDLAGVRAKMAYWFELLEVRLGLKPDHNAVGSV